MTGARITEARQAGRVRVLVVDDSPLCVEVLSSRIRSDPRLEVVGFAYDGLRAIELAARLRPAVITMDLQMAHHGRGMDGLAAIERIVREHPTPILVVTASDDRSTLAFEALRRGASDLITKPGPHEAHDELCERIWALARSRLGPRPERALPREPARNALVGEIAVVGMVASTGGPAALATVLGELPASFGAGIAVVQHLPSGFVERLARWLDGVCALEVAIATEGESIEPGRVLLAPDDRHLTVDASRRVRLVPSMPVEGHRPSGTRLLASLAGSLGHRAAGVVLTGMGRDGADGLLALRRAGGRTLAQDEPTSAVFGMPRAAIEADAAEAVLPIGAMAAHLVSLVRRGAR
jgi:two-component system chemotaxis response regulator CheB